MLTWQSLRIEGSGRVLGQCAWQRAHSSMSRRSNASYAQHMRQRKLLTLTPGDLVYYWRRQQAGKTHKSEAGSLGPARALATDMARRRTERCTQEQSLLNRGGHLLRAAPEQLRPAFSRKDYIHEIEKPAELPWTFTDPSRQTWTSPPRNSMRQKGKK